MNKNIQIALQEKVTQAFNLALSEVIEKISSMLEDAADSNEGDSNQVSCAQMTITPKILIQYATPAAFNIEVRVPAKRIETVCGESSDSFQLDDNGEEVADGQEDLPGMEENE